MISCIFTVHCECLLCLSVPKDIGAFLCIIWTIWWADAAGAGGGAGGN